MTNDPFVDRFVRWVGVIGMYGGGMGVVVGVIILLIGSISTYLNMVVTGVAVVVAGGFVAYAGGYLVYYFGTPWEMNPRARDDDVVNERTQTLRLLKWEDESTSIEE